MFSDNMTDPEASNCTLDIETVAQVEMETEENCNNTGNATHIQTADVDASKILATNKTESNQIQKYITKTKQEQSNKESKNPGHYKNILKRKKRATPGIFHPHPALATLPLRIIADDDFDPLGYDSIITTSRPVIKENLKATAPQVFPQFTPLPRLPPGYLERFNVSTETNHPNPKKGADDKADIKNETPATKSNKHEFYHDAGNSGPLLKNESPKDAAKHDDDDKITKNNSKHNYKVNNDDTYSENDYENRENSPFVRKKSTKKENNENRNNEFYERFRPYDNFDNDKSVDVHEDKNERTLKKHSNTAGNLRQSEISENGEAISSTPVPNSRARNQNEKHDNVEDIPVSKNFKATSKLNNNFDDVYDPDGTYDQREKILRTPDKIPTDVKKDEYDDYKFNTKNFNNINNRNINGGASYRPYKTADKIENHSRDGSQRDSSQDEEEEVEYKGKSNNFNSNHQSQTDPEDHFRPYTNFDQTEETFPKSTKQDEESHSKDDIPRSDNFSSRQKLRNNSLERPYDVSVEKEIIPIKIHDGPTEDDHDNYSDENDDIKPQAYNFKPIQKAKNIHEENQSLHKMYDTDKEEKSNRDQYQEEEDENHKNHPKHQKPSNYNPGLQKTYNNEEEFTVLNSPLHNSDVSDKSENNDEHGYKPKSEHKNVLDTHRNLGRSKDSHNHKAYDSYPNQKSKRVKSTTDRSKPNRHYSNDDDRNEEYELHPRSETYEPNNPSSNKKETQSRQNIFIPEPSSISDSSDEKYIMNDIGKLSTDKPYVKYEKPENNYHHEKSELNDDVKTNSKPNDKTDEVEYNDSDENTDDNVDRQQQHKPTDDPQYDEKSEHGSSAGNRYSEGYKNYQQDENSSEEQDSPASINSDSENKPDANQKILFDVEPPQKKYYSNDDDKSVGILQTKNEGINEKPDYNNKEKILVGADLSDEDNSKESFEIDQSQKYESEEMLQAEKIYIPETLHQSYYPRSINTDKEPKIRSLNKRYKNSQLNDNLDQQIEPKQITDENIEVAKRRNNPEISYEIHHPRQNSGDNPNKLPRISHDNHSHAGRYKNPEILSNLEKGIRNGKIEYETYHPRKHTKSSPKYQLANLNLSMPDGHARSEISYKTYHPHTFANEYRNNEPDITPDNSKHRHGSIPPKPFETYDQRRVPEVVPNLKPNFESINTSEDSIQSKKDGTRDYNTNTVYGLKNLIPSIKSNSKSHSNLPNDAELPDLISKTPDRNVKQQFEKIPLDYMHDTRKVNQEKNLKSNKLQQTESNEKPSQHEQEDLEENSDSQDKSENEEKDTVEYDPESEVKFGDLDLPVIKLPESVLGYYDSANDEESDIKNDGKEDIQEETNGDEEYNEENENLNDKEPDKESQNYKIEDEDLYGKFFSDDDLYESFVRDNFNKKGNFVERSQKIEVEPNFEKTVTHVSPRPSKNKNKIDPNPDLYENFVRNRFDKKGTFAERSQKITMDPTLKKTMQDVLKHVNKNTREAEKSNDPKYGYMWTLNYGRPL